MRLKCRSCGNDEPCFIEFENDGNASVKPIYCPFAPKSCVANFVLAADPVKKETKYTNDLLTLIKALKKYEVSEVTISQEGISCVVYDILVAKVLGKIPSITVVDGFWQMDVDGIVLKENAK